MSLSFPHVLFSVTIIPSWPVSFLHLPLKSLVMSTSSIPISLHIFSTAPSPLPFLSSTFVLGHVFLLPSWLWPFHKKIRKLPVMISRRDSIGTVMFVEINSRHQKTPAKKPLKLVSPFDFTKSNLPLESHLGSNTSP